MEEEDLKRAKIREFLIEFKRIITQGRGLDIINRRVNMDTLSKLGITKKNLKEELIALSVNNYCQGPEPDKDRPGHIWVFGKQIGEEEIYIKLKIAQVGNEKLAKCLSFHTADFPLCYPYHGKERRDKT